MNKNNKFILKSAQFPKKSKSKINLDKYSNKKDLKEARKIISSKSFISKCIFNQENGPNIYKSNFSTDYNSINKYHVKSKNQIKVPEINDFKINDDITKIVLTTDINISNILIDSKETIDDYILTNHFDLLTEELESKNELYNIEREENNDIFKNYYKIEYDEILDDIWLNLVKYTKN